MGSTTLGQTASEATDKLRRYGVPALLALVIVYAALAGLRTITDPDTGWQLATGRYIFQHHQIPTHDVLSYTARGTEWIYPAFSQLFLYFLYLIGAFAALSWLNAAACAATVGIAFWGEAGIAAALLATLAIPKIAYRTAPRADLFSSVLFAALLVVLWRRYRGRPAPLWLVPMIFLVWANTHLGFIAGFALLIAYAGLEFSEFLHADRRAEARARLRSALPWLAAAVPVTLCNPWGWKIYSALLRQERDMASQQNVIAEWRHVPLNAGTLAEALRWRDPSSSYYWLLALAVIAAAVALKRRQIGPAALLLGSAYESVQHIRFQGLFSIVAIVVAAPFLSTLFTAPQEAQELPKKTRAQRRRELSHPRGMRLPSLAPYASRLSAAVLVMAVALIGIRVYDLVTQRAYIAAGEVSLFGAGISSWYPERAAAFVLSEKLPGNLFHDYNLGGFVSFQLGPQYPNYIDGRAIPFGALMAEQRDLMRQSPDSAAWQQEADRRGINTLIFSLARYWGLPAGSLRAFCTSTTWKPVYLDEVSIVLLRNHPENASWLNRLAVDCNNVKFEPPAALANDGSSRGRAELFNYYAHAGAILAKLARNTEAKNALDQAIGMYPEEPFLHQVRGQLYDAVQQPGDAEREYLTSARLKPTEATWYTLARLYSAQQRYAEAADALQQAAQISVHPSQYYISLGSIYVAMRKPQQAIDAFDAAAENSSFEAPEMRAQIESEAAAGRARASNAMRATP